MSSGHSAHLIAPHGGTLASTPASLAPLGYEVVNLGADAPTPLLEVLRFVEACVGRPVRVEHLPRHPPRAVPPSRHIRCDPRRWL